MTTMLTDDPTTVPMVLWPDFASHFRWTQGEHVGLIGPTGSGKTHLAQFLLPMRKYVVILATKPRDKSLDVFGKKQGYKVMPKWESLSIKRFPRRMVWPNSRQGLRHAADIQAAVFRDAVDHIFVQGGWTVYIDELWYVGDTLGMKRDVKLFLQQARSMDESLVIASQRPAWIPVEVYDQSTHLFFWKDNDITNLRRIGGIGSTNTKIIIETVKRLPKYHVLYMNTRTEQLLITKPPKGL